MDLGPGDIKRLTPPMIEDIFGPPRDKKQLGENSSENGAVLVGNKQ